MERSGVMLRRESDSRGLFSSGDTSDNDYEETFLCENCGKNRKMKTRYSEGYGTEEECGLSDPQGDSDADADIEDTDSRLQEPGSLQRISSRRRKRPRVARQDTTESEDDGGHSNRTHRWNLRLSPAHSRPILEESISQVRPLIVCRPSAHTDTAMERSKRSLPPPLLLLLLLLLPLSLSAVIIVSYLLPWTSTR
ncbi:uncharacterized protein si:ch211-63p21.1 [Periophthalmus magnuspinnatus]|uniref:uncharacterized protein si:ch211-63p21.1 n=1 Tax=Periophthalmus magnuspinnatus TaxID=409849 RepID=UPI00243698A2|nr:uncharacterized protein si:ch211-63p21.1 [Periophthalmus magnuspinnatus]